LVEEPSWEPITLPPWLLEIAMLTDVDSLANSLCLIEFDTDTLVDALALSDADKDELAD
jgi:hypothetical protein